jgi:diguanylate cyclase (GGDEF)-like protein
MVKATADLPSRRAWTVSIAAFVATVAIDHLAGILISFSFLYLVAAAVAVWSLGERRGLLLSTVAILVAAVIKHFEFAGISFQGHGISLAAEAWNTFARILSVTVVGVVVDGLRAALALERWRASTDGLTGALNKSAFQEQVALIVERARADRRALVLGYMDLDGFKGVNDRHGHSAGDRVLRAFAEAAAKSIRGTDLFARIGGDEFVVLMSVKSCEEGDQVAELLHARLTRILRDTGYAVTCSMGALVSKSDQFDLHDGGLELADTLMYEVKRAGKNALRIARGGAMSARLHAAYPLVDDDAMADILGQIDRNESVGRGDAPSIARPGVRSNVTASFFSPAPRPFNEDERQSAVDETNIVNAPADPVLQAICAAGARLFDAPMAALSIIDRDRQWFAARVGLDATETSRAISFCAHTILTPDQLMVVPDATQDRRFAGSPVVQDEPGVRFYAGAPVIGPNGQPIGALCVVDKRPRGGDLPLEELARLAEQAGQVIAELSATAKAA